MPDTHHVARPAAADALMILRRDGRPAAFDPGKINRALSKAFLAVEGSAAAASHRIHEVTAELTDQVVAALTRHGNPTLHIEDIQDQVELALMRNGHHKVARAYVLYREQRAQERAAAAAVVAAPAAAAPRWQVKGADGTMRPLDEQALAALVAEACAGLPDVSPEPVLAETRRNIYDGISEDELAQAPILAARTLIEQEPNYSTVSARLLLAVARREATGFVTGLPVRSQAEMAEAYPDYFTQYVARGIEVGLLNPVLAQFELEKLGAALKPERDLQFQYLGFQTLYDRYLLQTKGVRFEMPQAFFMRVAMGLALNEIDREARAIEFYDLISSFDFMCSTPTLFNSGTRHSQLSSCFLTSVPDDLDGIFGAIKDNALLAKYSGGIGNSWTRVRGLGAHIRGTNGASQGVVPFLKVTNDTAIAVNQGGKRKGAVCAYLESWHIDVEEFLDLRKNTGDDRRRTHDMNTANWVPDLFMQRVEQDGEWTLFSPDETPDLHDLYGIPFREAYERYEAKAKRGEMNVHKTIRAVDLWRRMLTMLFETGHPWMTFKDPCNLRSPQRHAGVVHSSNLCTEITLNTSDSEVAVCNLGSINMGQHIVDGALDRARLQRTIRTAMRMLDNVIDVNFYTIPQARRSNLRHRPIGMGLMGFQDALHALRLPLASEEAVRFADESMELVSYHAIEASVELAAERGAYASFPGSLWSQGVLPVDSIKYVSEARGEALDQSATLDWEGLRERVKTTGMRNSNTMAIAPTATISNIVGATQSIEPTFRNLYVKANMSGDFTVVNPALVRDLKARGLWDAVMVSDLKYYDGSLGPIDRIPDELKALYATAFEVDPSWLIEAAARRQKWIDQAQSLNLYLANPNGKKLDQLYRLAWKRGLKTTYYLRTQAATHVEKSTMTRSDGKLNAVKLEAAPAPAPVAAPTAAANVCLLDDPTCEACQ